MWKIKCHLKLQIIYGNKEFVFDKSGVAILPCSYSLRNFFRIFRADKR